MKRPVAAFVALLGCGMGSGGSAQVEPAEPEPPAEQALGCRPFDVGAALTSFAGEPCPWVLQRDDGVLELLSQGPKGAPRFEGEVPGVCTAAPCDFAGRVTTVGPLVLAVQRSPASEMAAGVLLGVGTADGKLVFVDLWEDAGDAVFDEGTDLGPAQALAPFDCGGAPGLFARPRTNGGEQVEAAVTLRAREGVYRDGKFAPSDRARCVPLDWPMP